MSDSDSPQVDVKALHEAIKTGLREAFSTDDVPTVDYYARPGAMIVAPAIFFELDEATPNGSGNCGTQQLALDFSFSAWCVVGSKGGGTAQMAVRTLALAVAAAINGKRWGQPVSPARVERIEEAEFVGEPNRAYYAYRVGWTHGALVGVSVWDADKEGVTPTGIYLGVTPDVGTEHEADYEKVSE